jgi:putative tryptophan/tyrosine transport system substrate-binding protein
MRRREFITLVGGAAALPLVAHAQQPAMPLIGFLSGRSLATDAHLVAAFRQGLSEAGYVEGRDVAIEYHWADGQFDRLPAMATDLVKHQVSVIFAGGMDVKLKAVKAAIPTIPIVFATGTDPVELGLVASMSRPGGNVTAVTVLTTALQSKRLELLRNLLSSVTLVALLLNPNHPAADTITKDVRTAAKALGVQIYVAAARGEDEIDDAIAAVKRERADALLVPADPVFIGRRQQVIGLAKRFGIPTMFDRRDFPVDGGLMSYGASIVDQYLQSGRYVGRILKGSQPAELPVLQPTRFEFVINIKTAKALGLAVPPSLLALADEVIE